MAHSFQFRTPRALVARFKAHPDILALFSRTGISKVRAWMCVKRTPRPLVLVVFVALASMCLLFMTHAAVHRPLSLPVSSREGLEVPEDKGTPLIPESFRSKVVVAIMSSPQHAVGWARSSRSWRFGIPLVVSTTDPIDRKYVAEGALHNETYVHWRSNTVEPRNLFKFLWAITPTLAFEKHPDVDWLLYGDDDTVFFPDVAYRVLQQFDSAYPHIINDHVWLHPNHVGPRINMRHGDPISGRCVPCGTYEHATLLDASNTAAATAQAAAAAADAGSNGTAVALGVLEAFAANKTAHAIVLAAVNGKEGGGVGKLADPIPQTRGYDVWRPPEACPVCTWETVEKSDPERLYINQTRWKEENAPIIETDPTMHGGGGMIFSRGMMRQLTRAFMTKTCFASSIAQRIPGGDSLLSRCAFWSGVAPTETGSFIRNQKYQAFGPNDYQSKLFLDDAYSYLRTSGTCCNAECRYRLENTVALHLRTAHFVTPESGQRTADVLGRAREAYLRARAWMQEPKHSHELRFKPWDSSLGVICA